MSASGAGRARPTATGAGYTMSLAGCFDGAIGSNGLSQRLLDTWTARLEPSLDRLRKADASGQHPVLRSARMQDDIAPARRAMSALSAGARTIVFLGTGGSSLGGQAIAQLAGWNIPGSADAAQLSRPRTRFYDNLDPFTLARSLASLDIATARFVVISKSGGTPETLVQAIAALDAIRKAGLASRIPGLVLGVTEPARPGAANPLRALLEAHGAPILDHDPDLGGRFSALSVVGALPALARGLDPTAIRAGAAGVLDALAAAKHPGDMAPAAGAALLAAMSAEKGIRTLVLMPYADRLGRFGHWWVQLWAESLGKGGKGTTPLAALGPLDQHSQLQLFMDGPREHLLTVVRVKEPFGRAQAAPALADDLARIAGVPYLAGRSAADLVAAQAIAVPEALARAGRPVRTFDLDVLDGASLGALMMHMMLETILAADLIGVDPFGQPAVELAKELARARLGRTS